MEDEVAHFIGDYGGEDNVDRAYNHYNNETNLERGRGRGRGKGERERERKGRGGKRGEGERDK